LIAFSRLKYSFLTIEIDTKERTISCSQLKKIKKISFNDNVLTKDFPNKRILAVNDSQSYITIPKEINNYPFLYDLLTNEGLIEETREFDNFKTSIGFYSYFILVPLLACELFLISLVTNLIKDFDGTFNSILGLMILSSCAVGNIFFIIYLTATYRFIKSGIIINRLFYRNLIEYSRFNKFEYDPAQRTLTITLINDKLKWFRKLIRSSSILILEPGNISIEQMYFEIEKRKTTCNHT